MATTWKRTAATGWLWEPMVSAVPVLANRSWEPTVVFSSSVPPAKTLPRSVKGLAGFTTVKALAGTLIPTLKAVAGTPWLCTSTSNVSVSPLLATTRLGLTAMCGVVPVDAFTDSWFTDSLTRSVVLSPKVPSALIPAYTEYTPTGNAKVLVRVSQA